MFAGRRTRPSHLLVASTLEPHQRFFNEPIRSVGSLARLEKSDHPPRRASDCVLADHTRELARSPVACSRRSASAVGILMAQHRSSQDEAVALLERASQYRNVLLRDLAAEVVESFSRCPPRTRFES